MQTTRTISKMLAAAAALGFAGTAWAACNANSTETGATSIQLQDGHGNLACSDFIGRSLVPNAPAPVMSDITASANVAITPGSGGNAIDWVISDPALEADIIFIKAPNGDKCIYHYGNDARKGDNLSVSGTKSIKNVDSDVVICSDGVLTDPPQQASLPPPPIATVACGDPNNSTGSLQSALDQLPDANGDIDVLIGAGEDANGDFKLAVCSDQSDGGQVQCGGCVRPEGYPDSVGKTSQACLAALAANGGAGPNGELPLECRACELSSILPPSEFSPALAGVDNYCWELHDQVDEVAGTFIPAKAIDHTQAGITRFEGSSCYMIRVNFYGIEYIYYAPWPGCPGS
jgi:hypothetical protein